MVIDIKKENPLKTIIKNGKVPVVRIANDGFKTHDQTKFNESYKEELNGLVIPDGCFVEVGGIQGRYVSGWHINEPLHIGFMEPDTNIFVTYPAAKKSTLKKFSFTTAKERLSDIEIGYKESFPDEISIITTDMPLEDFDLQTEAIVKAEDVTDVLTVYPKDFYLFLPYMNDGYLRLLCLDNIFTEVLTDNGLSSDFLSFIGEENYYTEREQFKDTTISYDSDGNIDYRYFDDFFNYNSTFQKMILKEFESFYLKKPHIYTSDTIKDFKETWKRFNKWKLESKKWKHCLISKAKINISENYFKVFFSLNLYFGNNPEKIESIDFSLYKGNLLINVCKENPKYKEEFYKTFRNSNYEIKEPKYIEENLTVNDLFKNKYRFFMYDFLSLFNYYYKEFSKFFEINIPDYFKNFEAFKQVEDNLSGWEYHFDDKYSIIKIKLGNFGLEYDTILKDAVIEISDDEKKYYNIDTLPKDYDTELLDYFLGILSPLRMLSLFLCLQNHTHVL